MIYAVTNRKLIVNEDIYSVVEKLCKFGADAIILREKDLESNDLFNMASKIKYITNKYNKLLIINSNLQVAKKVQAYAVHFGYREFIELKMPLDINVGVSVHSMEEAINADQLGAGYILLGNIYETDCKKGLKGKGEIFLKQVIEMVSIPVIAIGGINEYNIKNIRKTGAYGVAIMSLAMKSPDKINKITNYNII